MDGHEKASAGEPAKARSYDGGDDVTRHEHSSANSTGAQAESAAERLFKLFAGNEHRHVKNFGPPVWNEDKAKVETQNHNGRWTCDLNALEPASLSLIHFVGYP